MFNVTNRLASVLPPGHKALHTVPPPRPVKLCGWSRRGQCGPNRRTVSTNFRKCLYRCGFPQALRRADGPRRTRPSSRSITWRPVRRRPRSSDFWTMLVLCRCRPMQKATASRSPRRSGRNSRARCRPSIISHHGRWGPTRLDPRDGLGLAGYGDPPRRRSAGNRSSRRALLISPILRRSNHSRLGCDEEQCDPRTRSLLWSPSSAAKEICFEFAIMVGMKGSHHPVPPSEMCRIIETEELMMLIVMRHADEW